MTMSDLQHFAILSRYTGEILYQGDAKTLGDLVGMAVKENANLVGANLVGANLEGANLWVANLVGANLRGANLEDANLWGANLGGANLWVANLVGANLVGANLVGANLWGANLRGANLEDANLWGGDKTYTLVGNRPYFDVGPIGSRASQLVAYLTDRGPMVRAGCWFGTLAEFQARVDSVYPAGNIHGDEYRAAITMVECHARLWTPAKEDDHA